MKRTLFKQLMVSALFVCSLSADVPDVGQISKHPTSNAQRPMSNVEHPMSVVSLATHQTGLCSFDLYNGSAIRPLSSAVCRPSWTMPDPMALMLSAVWLPDGLGIYQMDRVCVRWDVLPSVSPEMINVPTDPLAAAFLVPRYRMCLALQESAWPTCAKATVGRPRPAGCWEPALSLDVAYPSGRADIVAMIPRLKEIFTKEGIPQQWVWVAEVESALNPRARSSAGAVGLFQLMPGTAQRFGLRTAPVDDRMAPDKSAGAAAQYLKFLRQEFGCWSLALAAYNAGEGRVREIMKKRKARTFEDVERYLPSETRVYVPKVVTIVALREDQLHGVRSACWMP